MQLVLGATATFGSASWVLLYRLPGDHTFGLWLVGLLVAAIVACMVLGTERLYGEHQDAGFAESPTTKVTGSLDRRTYPRPEWQSAWPDDQR